MTCRRGVRKKNTTKWMIRKCNSNTDKLFVKTLESYFLQQQKYKANRGYL